MNFKRSILILLLAALATAQVVFGNTHLASRQQFSPKWVEVNFLDDDATNNYGILEFGNIWKSIDKMELFSSAGISCAPSAIPYPSGKTKQIGVIACFV